MNLSIKLWLMGLILTVASPCHALMKTDLAKVGGVIGHIDKLMISTLKAKQAPLKTALPEVATSYVPGQGITIFIKTITPQWIAHLKQVTTVSPEAKADNTEAQLAATKRAAHIKKARDMAHSAHSLREQSKSLERSMKNADEAQKNKLDEKLKAVRKQMRSLSEARRLHASLAPKQHGANTTSLSEQRATNNVGDGYVALQQQLVLALCRNAQQLAAIADKETVSLVMARDKTTAKPGQGVEGWMIEKSLLVACAEGLVDQQYLQQKATRYQY